MIFVANFSYNCPGCGAKLTVVADSQEDAEGKMMQEGGKHAEEAHGGEAGVSNEEMKQHVHEHIAEEA